MYYFINILFNLEGLEGTHKFTKAHQIHTILSLVDNELSLK